MEATRETTPMRFRFRPMRWRDALTISRWHYDGPYAFYDMSLLVLLGVVAVQWVLRSIRQLEFYGAYAERGGREQLIGVFSFLRHGNTIEIGLGLRPDLTGQGIGLPFVLAGLEYARTHSAPKRFQLIVAAFNTRAIRVYERAGFTPVRTFTDYHRGRPYAAILMERDA
ncbi:MAG TPA: GNAT family protein [Ktedonobacterales bacterium]